ncbi:radical SAM protein with 4Fe4S-binding SPASM domain [Lachnotalea glycerini]|uniref:Radical SAM protein with 4Fe4S-binding SPASM domain n=1 Tax=Lachnotalea glycerini TaxID=1763509 RepID=A0A318ERZ2_9FIRM|nr:radical SAM protein with 4Fe4S-binding SPASM domain [Lachnotalea glycerini]
MIELTYNKMIKEQLDYGMYIYNYKLLLVLLKLVKTERSKLSVNHLVFKLKCDTKDYDVLYWVDEAKIARISKTYDIDKIQLLENIDHNLDQPKLRLGHEKVGVTFMSARTCNLRCRYCFAGEGEYGNVESKPKYMTYELYMKSIKMVLDMYQEGIKSISFFGGEPLIGYKEISKVIPDILNLFEEKHLDPPLFSVITNLVLIDQEIINFIKKYNIKVAISLDGDKEINDIARIGITKEMSVYDSVMRGVDLLKSNHVNFLLQATINQHHLEMYEPGAAIKWAESIERTGCSNFTVVPVESSVTDLQISGTDALKKLDMFTREITQYYLKKLVTENDMKVIPTGIVSPIFQIIKKKKEKSCTAGHSLFIDTDGRAYPCHTFCNFDDACIGDIQKGLIKKQVEKYANLSRFDGEECKECIARNICVLWCKGIQLLSNGDLYKVCEPRCVYQKAIMEECIKFLAELKKDSGEYRNLIHNYKNILNKLGSEGFLVKR